MSPVMPLADRAAEKASAPGLSAAAEATIAAGAGSAGMSEEGSDCAAVMVGAAMLATRLLGPLLNQPITVSSRFLPVIPSNATSATELTAPQRPPYSVSPAILSTGPRCSP